jgi:hypothetical protein
MNLITEHFFYISCVYQLQIQLNLFNYWTKYCNERETESTFPHKILIEN